MKAAKKMLALFLACCLLIVLTPASYAASTVRTK